MNHEIHLEIEGMDCPGCVATVRQALTRVPGVVSANVALVTSAARVTVEEEGPNRDVLTSAVGAVGYGVAEEGDDCSDHHHSHGSLWLSAKRMTLLSGVLFFAGLAGQWAGWRSAVGGWLWSDLLLLAAAAVGGVSFLPAGVRALFRLSLDMNFLMSAAIVGAAAIGEYVEAAAIAFLFSVAELLEGYAIDRARRSIETLMSVAPDTATLRREGEEIVVPAEDVVVGDCVIVRPGDRLAVDGRVTQGASAIDESTITGESMPVSKEIDDDVFAGTINREGYLEVEATRPASESTLARIVKLIEEAESNRAPSERFVERFSRFYTPAVTIAAVLVTAIPTLAFGGDFDVWFLRGLTLLVIACPCALVISTPVAVVSAITGAARHGVLIKGGSYLEALGGTKVVALDKTGTLTRGEPEVTDVVAFNGRTREDVVILSAALERHSRHPVAEAIVSHAGTQDLPDVEGFESITGLGVQGQVGGIVYRVGRPGLFDSEIPESFEALQADSRTAVLVGSDTEVLGAVVVEDTVRSEARGAIEALRKLGIRTVMLTGDNEATARRIAESVGVDAWHAGLMPEDKVALVQQLEEDYGQVAMVGDGVNDAPALAAATVGIAMGVRGTDTAIETADVALMGDDLSKIPYLMRLSRASRGVIRQNVIAAIIVKVGLAIGVVPGFVSLVVAVLAGDVGTSVGVTTNAMRLAGVKPNAK
jgi:Cd2+/Zn2+-exporting ATPase